MEKFKDLVTLLSIEGSLEGKKISPLVLQDIKIFNIPGPPMLFNTEFALFSEFLISRD